MPPTKHFAPPAGIKAPPLSFATRVGDLLFISGIPGFDENGELPDGFEAQFGYVVTNIKRVLDEAGATFRDLAKVNVLLTRASDVATMNVLYASAFGPAPYPARTTCVVAVAAQSKNADRDRGCGVAGGAVIDADALFLSGTVRRRRQQRLWPEGVRVPQARGRAVRP